METKKINVKKIMLFVLSFALLIPCFFILTACGGDNNKNEQELKDNEISITVSNKVYDGQAIAVTATATSGQTPIIGYKLANADDSTYTQTAPQNVGEYVVMAGVEANDEFKSATKTANFSITAKEVGLTWTAPANLVYDGQAKVPTVEATGLVDGDACEVQIILNQGNNQNVGSFTYVANDVLNSNYKLPTNVTSPQYEITPIILNNLNVDFEYNGETSYTVNEADLGIAGVSLIINFENKNVGANVIDCVVIYNDEETQNYVVNTNTCVANIVQKEIGLTWTAPTNLVYDEQAKVPTVEATGLVEGDVCEVQNALTAGDDNITYDSSFTFTATGLTGENAGNYKLPEITTSDEYTISIDSIAVNTSEYVDLEKDEVTYYKISLVNDCVYYFTFDADEQGSVFTFELQKKDGTLVATRTVVWPTPSTYEIDEAGIAIQESDDYCIKVTALTNGINSGDVTIKEDDHNDEFLDAYGFCTKCGAYQGDTIDYYEDVTVSLQKDGKAYYRIAYAGDNIKFRRLLNVNGGNQLQSGDFTYYASLNNNNFEAITIGNSFAEKQTPYDDYYYIVLTAPSQINNGVFRFEDELDDYGIAKYSNYYAGSTLQIVASSADKTEFSMNNGDVKYYRFEVEEEVSYDIKCDATLDADISYGYFNTDGTFETANIENSTTTVSLDDIDMEKPYVYILITATDTFASHGIYVTVTSE